MKSNSVLVNNIIINKSCSLDQHFLKNAGFPEIKNKHSNISKKNSFYE